MLEGEGLGQMVQPASKRHCVQRVQRRGTAAASPRRVQSDFKRREDCGIRERAAHRPPRWITSFRMALKEYYKASRIVLNTLW
jgi:hypothetical protein